MISADAAQRGNRQRAAAVEDPRLDASDEPAGWRVVAASEAGAGHVRSGTPCQDANAFLRIDDDWLAIAVADGAGSAAQGELGAATAVNVAVCNLAEVCRLERIDAKSFDHARMREMLRQVFVASRTTVESEAIQRGVPARQLACTLIIVLLGPEHVAGAQVGDGGAIAEHADGQITTVLRPDPGEYINEATFLTSHNALESLQFAVLDEGLKSIGVITDGLQMLALRFPGWQPFQPFFRPVFDFFRDQQDSDVARDELRRMLRSEEVRSRTHDDVTLLVATRLGRASREPVKT